MQKILINGNFLCRNLTGIERFAWELLRRLDVILPAGSPLFLLVPANAKSIPQYKNIGLIKSEKAIKGFPKWDLVDFPKELKKEKAVALNFSNTAPLGKKCGIAFLHDIYAFDCPEDFSSFRDRLVKLYSCLHYKNITKNALMVAAVSDFSKKQIQKAYNLPEKRICVINNGWEHFKSVKSDASIFERFPELSKKDFYFTLGSLSKRKNLKWIAKYAKSHQKQKFAVSGKAISGLLPAELEVLKKLSNVILLGYVTDGEVKALMSSCKAFLFPSYYEGFGIPPLEALSCGAKVISSNAASLPEIYGKAVHYINPDSTDCDLDELLTEQVESPEKVLETYTYENAAKKLLKMLESL